MPFAAARFLLIAVFLLAVAEGQNRQVRNPLANDPEAVVAGRGLFVEKCSPCHGPSGEGGHGPSLVEGRGIRRLSDPELYSSVKNGVPGTDMSGFPLSDEQIWQIVAFSRSLIAPAAEQPAPGDIQAGGEIFWGRGGCSSCHSIRGQGGVIGPDLTDIATLRRGDQLATSITKPSEAVADGFRAVEVTLPGGKDVKGIAKFENNYTLTLLDREGRLHFLRKKELQQIAYPAGSLMPADYGDRLSEKEMQDLLAFLSRQTLRK
ncbi:MAG: c-type cytochrome [Acidobacteria bacterium]|nr:c-type cytochrome [Acidobacteriota bacterium]